MFRRIPSEVVASILAATTAFVGGGALNLPPWAIFIGWAGTYLAGGPHLPVMKRLWAAMPVGSTLALIVVLLDQQVGDTFGTSKLAQDAVLAVLILVVNAALMYIGRVKAFSLVPAMFLGFASFIATYFGGFGWDPTSPWAAWIAVITMNALGPVYAWLAEWLVKPRADRLEPAVPAADALDIPLRRVVLIVAALNFAYFFVEFSVALFAGSVSLLADSVDFLEDTSINVLIFIALGWPLARRAVMGKLMATIILGPAAYAAFEAVQRFGHPQTPAVIPLVVASLGAIVVNGVSALLLVRVRHGGGSLSRAAFLSARNDVLVNVAVIAMGVLTAATGSGWPDLIVGCAIILLALHAVWEVWEVSEEERLAAKALAGDELG